MDAREKCVVFQLFSLSFWLTLSFVSCFYSLFICEQLWIKVLLSATRHALFVSEVEHWCTLLATICI